MEEQWWWIIYKNMLVNWHCIVRRWTANKYARVFIPLQIIILKAVRDIRDSVHRPRHSAYWKVVIELVPRLLQ